MTDTTKPDGGPAFPKPDHATHYTPDGMSLRDYFAAKAMALMYDSGLYPDPETVAIRSYAVADAMLKERAR